MATLRTDEELSILTGAEICKIQEFREIFRLVDLDGSGYIDADELKKLMMTLHFDYIASDEKNFSAFIAHISRRGSNDLPIANTKDLSISFDDFIIELLKQPEKHAPEEVVRNAFELLAGKHTQKGKISRHLLKSILEKEPPDDDSVIDHSVIEEIMSMLGENSDGMVDYDEIISFMMNEFTSKNI